MKVDVSEWIWLNDHGVCSAQHVVLALTLMRRIDELQEELNAVRAQLTLRHPG